MAAFLKMLRKIFSPEQGLVVADGSGWQLEIKDVSRGGGWVTNNRRGWLTFLVAPNTWICRMYFSEINFRPTKHMKQIFSENWETNFEFFNQWCNELMWTISGALNWYNCTRSIPFKNNLLKPKFLALLTARRAPFDLVRIASPVRSKEAHVKRIEFCLRGSGYRTRQLDKCGCLS